MNKKIDAVQAIAKAVNYFLSQEYSEDYKRDIKMVGKNFVFLLVEQNLHTNELNNIDIDVIEDFLNIGGDKAGTYEHNRRTLKSIYKYLVDQKIIPLNPLDNIEIKAVARKRKTLFTNNELISVLEYLKNQHPDFYLFANINYYVLYKKITTLCREIKRQNFSKDFSELKIKVEGNKTIIFKIEDNLKKVLLGSKELNTLNPRFNIFSKEESSFNRHYFNKKWLKIKKELLQHKITKNLDYDIDVFFDCAVYQLYQNKKDIKFIQNKLGFTNMFKTVYYLESIIDFS